MVFLSSTLDEHKGAHAKQHKRSELLTVDTLPLLERDEFSQKWQPSGFVSGHLSGASFVGPGPASTACTASLFEMWSAGDCSGTWQEKTHKKIKEICGPHQFGLLKDGTVRVLRLVSTIAAAPTNLVVGCFDLKDVFSM